MKLSEYKKKNRFTVADLADRFGVSRQTMYAWIRSEAVIVGREKAKRIELTRVLAEEGVSNE